MCGVILVLKTVSHCMLFVSCACQL